MRFAGGLARDFRRRGVDLGEFVVQPLRGELQSGRAVGISLDDLGAGLDVFAVDGQHDLGAGKVQFVITPIDVYALGINHRAHRAVEDADTVFLNNFAEFSTASDTDKAKTSRLKTTRGLLRLPFVSI